MRSDSVTGRKDRASRDLRSTTFAKKLHVCSSSFSSRTSDPSQLGLSGTARYVATNRDGRPPPSIIREYIHLSRYVVRSCPDTGRYPVYSPQCRLSPVHTLPVYSHSILVDESGRLPVWPGEPTKGHLPDDVSQLNRSRASSACQWPWSTEVD